MRGKNSLSVTEIVLSSGSLPRVREKQLILQFINYTSRITPAYAGKLSCNLLHGIYCGITPASAGKTFFYHVAMVDVQYRPHVCGKNISDILKMVRVLGSPPRMREKLNLKRFIRLNERITPAYAGKT